MGYLHIENLYKSQDILLFKECYALEKIHGSSANVSWDPEQKQIKFHVGGCSHENFVKLFDKAALRQTFESFQQKVSIFGEAYGGKMQGMGARYGKDLKFVAFDVKIGDCWLAVPQAEEIVKSFGLEFVHYVKCSTDLNVLNAERDAPSVQAQRNGMGDNHKREGVVLRPLIELTTNNGERVICKHKRDEERETKNTRAVNDPALLKVLTDAKSVAEEWVTEIRLQHVLDKLDTNLTLADTRKVIDAMIEDVLREGNLEIVDSKEARQAIGNATGRMFKTRMTKV